MNTKAKVIFVNSFKGGAGKTTLALTHCIDNLFHTKEEQYENTIYIDLDVLGTGICYLFREGLLTEDNCFEKTGEAVEVQLEQQGKKESLYVAHLNPALKVRSVYGDKHFINHQGIASEELKHKVSNYIATLVKETPNTLIVIDCAPGFTDVEQAILMKCYQMMMNGVLVVEEDYITTLNSSHMQKCIQCLDDSIKAFSCPLGYRNINIVINDVQNYSGYIDAQSPGKVETRWENIVDKLMKKLGNKGIIVWRWKYSEDIAQQNVFTEESAIENQTDLYIFTDDNFKKMYPKEVEKVEEEKKKGVK